MNNFYFHSFRRYLPVGHSQNSGDTMHGNIESNAKDKSIYTQEQWCTIMREAIQTKPYSVHQFHQTEFLDWAKLSDERNWGSIAISDIDYIKFTRSDIISFQYLEDDQIYYKDLTFPRKIVNPWKTVEILPAYEKKLPIDADKAEDLRKMMDNLWIPAEHHDFFNEILKE